ncbi:MAG: glycosyltransferase family 4 protein [Thermoflexibacter sp.]|jgi:glycosyltransferase involved in cell wall biosynthesis|nr:glycosyltransferase family 4 protein [Thermoflexibacter sp.]
MRIGIIINSSWNIYNFRWGLIETFLQEGHEVVAIAPNDGFVEELKAKGCKYYQVNMERKGANPFRDLLLVHDLYKIYTQANLQVALHFTIKPNIYGSLAARLANIPAISNVTGLGTVFIRNNFTSQIAQLLYRFSFRFPKKVFFQNQDDLSLFLEKKLVSPQITDLLPGSGIDIYKFQPLPNQKKNTPFTFLLIARLLYDKGIIEYIESIKILKKQGLPLHFQLLGKIEEDKGLGITQDQLQDWLKQDLVEYIGATHDVRPYIHQADCIVLPSYREGTPRTLLEAASMGKPLIATNVAGCKETIIDEVNGLLCEVKNPQDLANKMKIMSELSEGKLSEMGEQSRLLAIRKFDQNIVIQKYKQAIGLSLA